MRPQRTENRVRNWATSMLMIVSLFCPDNVAVMNDKRRPGPYSYGELCHFISRLELPDSEFKYSRLEHDVRNAGHRATHDYGLPHVQCKRSYSSQSPGHAPEPSRGESPSATPGPQSQTTAVKEHNSGLKFSFQIAACTATLTGDCLNVRTPLFGGMYRRMGQIRQRTTPID